MASFYDSVKDIYLTTKIIERADKLGLLKDDLFLVIELTIANIHICPIDFERFLNSSENEFSREFTGIFKHLNVIDGTFDNGFRPRFAKHEDADTCNQNKDAA